MKWIAEDNKYLILYLTVTEKEFERISSDRKYYLDEEFVKQINNSDGYNCIITMVICKTEPEMLKKKLSDKLSDKFDRVSFWNRGHSKFRTRRLNK